ncbi:ATP-binding protein [Cyanobacteria bacterium FACHB-471]|nr:ATP-binding protein [Cyanobacteria bacterium FACHB-471]
MTFTLENQREDELEANRHDLMSAIAHLHKVLEQRLEATAISSCPTLNRLCIQFRLSEFERNVLLLCAAMELDVSFANLCAEIQGDRQAYPTFNLAMTAFAEPHWGAVLPDHPLRHWRLIEVGAGQTLMLSPLRIDERILHYLVGLHSLDERLKGMIQPVLTQDKLVPSHQQIAEQLVRVWSQQSASPIVQLWGSDGMSQQAIAAAACRLARWSLYTLPAQALPTAISDLSKLLLLWEREAMLHPSALLLDCSAIDTTDTNRSQAIAYWIDTTNTPLIISSRERQQIQQRPFITIEVYPPTKSEQRTLWQQTLGSAAPTLNGHIEKLVTQFTLNPFTIRTVCTEALTSSPSSPSSLPSSSSPPPAPFPQLWDSCRAQARPRLDDLAQRIDAIASWDDLVLPQKEKQVLQSIAAHVRQRETVYETWGFASKSGRGLGISALFAGASGTGKTMSAEVLALELQLDLYRIDLSSVVSKYIGETEKNLRKVFDAAEAGTTILLFDEADALFGKRSEVKDSHDRYANMEVSYLLQRMEAYRGLAILTTNLKDAIDPAFLRRLRFIVKFPFPDLAQREDIWRRIFPPQIPLANLDFAKLARLNVSGGNIRNIALNAAFLAADAEEPVSMKHLLEASRSEYIKLERSLTDAEVKGWV